MQADQASKSNGFLKRFYTALKEFDKALDYDPLEEVTKKVQILEKEVTELKNSIAKG